MPPVGVGVLAWPASPPFLCQPSFFDPAPRTHLIDAARGLALCSVHRPKQVLQLLLQPHLRHVHVLLHLALRGGRRQRGGVRVQGIARWQGARVAAGWRVECAPKPAAGGCAAAAPAGCGGRARSPRPTDTSTARRGSCSQTAVVGGGGGASVSAGCQGSSLPAASTPPTPPCRRRTSTTAVTMPTLFCSCWNTNSARSQPLPAAAAAGQWGGAGAGQGHRGGCGVVGILRVTSARPPCPTNSYSTTRTQYRTQYHHTLNSLTQPPTHPLPHPAASPGSCSRSFHTSFTSFSVSRLDRWRLRILPLWRNSLGTSAACHRWTGAGQERG